MKKFKNLVCNILVLGLIITIIVFIRDYRIYLILSGSMEPSLKIEELIVVEKMKQDSVYSDGDIITFYDEMLKTNVTHRVIEKTEEGYITKGDNNNTPDIDVVTKENVIGKVIFNSYYLGHIYIHYRYLIIIILILLMFILNISIINKSDRRGVNNE